MSDFRARIIAELDTSKVDERLKSIESTRILLNNISINTSGLSKKIQEALNGHKFTLNLSDVKVDSLSKTITGQMRSAGTKAGQEFARTLSSSLNNIHLKNGGIGNLSRMLQGAGFNKGSIAAITQELDHMVLSINKITTKQLANGNIRLTISGVDELNRAVSVVREFDKETGAVANTSKTFTQAFNQMAIEAEKVSKSLRTGDIEAAIKNYEAAYSRLSNSGHDKLDIIKIDLEELNRLHHEMSVTTDQSILVNSYERYSEVLQRVKNNLSIVSSAQKETASATDIIALQNKMESWLQKNTRAAKQYGSTINQLIQETHLLSSADADSGAKLQSLAAKFKEVDAAAESAGLKGKTFGSSIAGAFKSITRYASVSTLIYSAFNAIRNGIKDVIALDTALIDLQKTTDATASQLKQFYFNSNDIAKSLGVTTQEVIQAAADWSRLGYSIEDAQTMAEVSSIFASISPGMDIETATDGLVSAMKAFDIEAEDALDGIASKINAIGNSQAVTNEDIVNFLTRSSSAMKEANNTLEQTIALGTAATEITRDADGVGNAMKTISMRIRGYDEETEEFIGNIEVLEGDIASLTKTASKPGGISLFKDADKTEYKSTYELLRDISEIYDELTDKQQAQLLEKLAGKRQGQVIAAILNNFEAVENSLETMSNSAGSAMREMDIIEQSMEFKLNALKETAVGVFQNLFQTDDMGVVIDFLTKLLEGIDAVTNALGLFGTVLIGIEIAAFIKNFD